MSVQLDSQPSRGREALLARQPFAGSVGVTIALLYAVAGLTLAVRIGPWQAVRYAGCNALILVAWLWGAGRLMRGTPVPEPEAVRRPVAELAWSLGAVVVTVGLAANAYAGWMPLSRWVLPGVMIAAVLVPHVILGYPPRALGLVWPARQAWFALAAVVAINLAAAALFQLLPPGEAPPSAQADLANRITGPWSVVALLAGLLVGAALPEELLLRITLQPRLARFVPLGWAMLLQALLFSMAHLPQKLIGYGEPWIVALAYTMIVNNGLIGGYLWWRTRSLPLLLLLHLLAYPRLGI